MKKIFKYCWVLAIAIFSVSFMGITCFGASVSETEPNDIQGQAQNIDSYFSLDYNKDIGDMTSNTSTSIRHVTISGTLGINDFDYFAFTVTDPGATVIYDVDYGVEGGLTSFGIQWLGPSGSGDDYGSNDPNWGAGGSTSSVDSYYEGTLTAIGTHYVYIRNTGDTVGTYTLQVSAGIPVTPSKSIPTLSEWGMIFMSLMLAGTAIRMIRRRRIA